MFPLSVRKFRLVLLFGAVLGLASAQPLRAIPPGTVSVAAAADLSYCLDDINAAFHQKNPEVEVKVASGSSGNFATQIKNGAPFEVFLSADVSFPRDLIKAGLADESTLTTYATGKLVLWTAHPETVDVTKGPVILSDPKVVRKLAVANPDHAPYGRAAREALQHEKLWDAVQSRLVLGENISQTAQFVETGNADAGYVALSLVLSPKLAKVGKWQEIPAGDYAPLEQAAVLTKAGAAKPSARAYLEFLRSPEARVVFDRYGFRLPQKKG